MKKIIYILLGLAFLAPTIANAQKVTIANPNIRVVPAIYALDEEITWYFDFSDAEQVSAGDDLYLWIWNPHWPVRPTSDPNETPKTEEDPVALVNEGEKVWSITLIPTIFFDMTPDAIMNNGETFFWFNIRRTADASTGETGTLQIPKKDYVQEFVDGGKTLDWAPKDFWLDNTLSIIFNANTIPGFLPAPSTLNMHGGANDWTYLQSFDAWKPEIRTKTVFKDMGNGIYKKDLVPIDYFNGETDGSTALTEDVDLQNIVFQVVKYNGNDATPDWAGNSPAQTIRTQGAPVPPPTKFYLLPMKIGIEDILIITRDNNDSGQQLTYTLTGGGNTVSAPMEGAKSRQRAFVDLAAEFGGTGATSLHLVVSDNIGDTIYEGDIPLVTVDNITK